MDLILLQPGNSDIIGETSSTYIDNVWRDDVLQFGKCMELKSIHHGMKQQMTTDISNKARTSGRPDSVKARLRPVTSHPARYDQVPSIRPPQSITHL